MSYASAAKHNIPFGEMPQPDQGLADGHFAGETEAHKEVDHKINVLPAGSDVHHPDVPVSHPHAPATVQINPPPVPEPHVSDSAPKPAPAPHKGEIHIPQSGAEFEKKEKEVKKEVKETADQAEKKGKEIKEQAEQKGKEVKDKAEKLASKAEKKTEELADKAEKKTKELAKKAQNELKAAESKLGPYWERTKDIVLRPGTLGGLMGVVNVGILGTIGYYAYTTKDQYRAWDRRIVAAAVAGPLALFSAEGYVAESYLSTEEGKREAERAKREGSKLYLQARERILRPDVAGGVVGAINLAVLGTVGYFGYQNWNRTWDRQTISLVGAGLAALSVVEGYAGAYYNRQR